jgi:hypothetical protein
MELYFILTQPIAIVLDHLSDMQKFVAVHPIIYRVDFGGIDRRKSMKN